MVLPSTAIGLLEYLEGLSDEPSTLRHVVLISYGTWVKRTTFQTGDASIHKRQDFRDKVGQAIGMDLDPDGDFFDEHDEQDFDEDDLNRLHTFCLGIFHAIIADEAPKLKSPITMTSRSIKALGAPRHLLLTATPMVNRPLDLHGLLSVFYRPEWDHLIAGPLDPDHNDYGAALDDTPDTET